MSKITNSLNYQLSKNTISCKTNYVLFCTGTAVGTLGFFSFSNLETAASAHLYISCHKRQIVPKATEFKCYRVDFLKENLICTFLPVLILKWLVI